VHALIDTSALLALAHGRDQYHEAAVGIFQRHRARGGMFVGTTLILTELYSHLLYLRGPATARTALRLLLDDPIHRWHDVGAPLLGEARERWLERFADQPLSLVDAVSFEIMRRDSVHVAFAFDHHFAVVGYQLLSVAR
jgi:uncharacterized protein